MNRLFEVDGFWDRVEQACEESGLSKIQIADKMGMERKSLYKRVGSWHSGRLVLFCKITHVSADWLLGLSRLKRAYIDADDTVKFTVIDPKTGEEPILDRRHVFREKWFKMSCIDLDDCDIKCWALDEDGHLMLLDENENVAYPPIGRYEIVLGK